MAGDGEVVLDALRAMGGEHHAIDVRDFILAMPGKSWFWRWRWWPLGKVYAELLRLEERRLVERVKIPNGRHKWSEN